MDYSTVIENICVYDIRSPYYDKDSAEDKRRDKENCFCDNCFYGRHKLAIELLKHINH